MFILMENEELWRENTYKNLSDEQKAEVLKLIHAYICHRKAPANYQVKWDVFTVFIGFIESLKK